MSLNPSSKVQLDLSDPHVREMANEDHIPNEVWTVSGYVTVTCSMCAREWPCMTRQRLRALETKEEGA